MPRFFVPYTILEQDLAATIPEADSRHIRDVLRMKKGDEITLCDAQGTEHVCAIDTLGKEAVTLRILSRMHSASEPPFDIVVYQGLPKADKLETIIQKCVELGVSRIVPVLCARSVVKWKEEKDAEKKLTRWNRIAYEAAKQCGRSRIPAVEAPISLEEAIDRMARTPVAFMPWECEERRSIREVLEKAAKELPFAQRPGAERPGLAFLVGPEGGLDRDEAAYAVKNKIPTVTLGRRVLRTETAAPAILAMILYATEL